METPILMHRERCDLCGGAPVCVAKCPQQILTIGDRRLVMTHTDRCPEGCTICLEACPSGVFSLVEEVHEELGVVPSEHVEGAALVRHVSYRRAEDEREEEVRARFGTLCERLGIPPGQRSLGETRAHAWGAMPGAQGLTIQLSWELHTEYYFIRAILGGSHDLPSFERMEEVMEEVQRAGRPPVIASLEILLLPQNLSPGQAGALLLSKNRFGSKVLDGALGVYTGYEPVNGRERYVVAGATSALEGQGAFAIANICRIETYYHLLLIPRIQVRDSVQEVHRREHALSTRMADVTARIERATPGEMEAWLKELTVSLAETVRFSNRYNHILSSTFPYREMVREGCAAWKADPVTGFAPLSDIILERTAAVSEEYRTFLDRLSALRGEITDLVAILRTRVEMSMEQQNTQLLVNLDQRSAIQLRLQSMAEGLSVIVISYYLTGLAGYLFKALEKEKIIESAAIPTALFVPVAVLCGYLVSRKGAKLVHHLKDKDGGH